MKSFKNTIKLFTIISVGLLAMVLLFYFMAPVYKFSGPVPFEGNKLYNPYDGMNAAQWKKYTFETFSISNKDQVSTDRNRKSPLDSAYRVLGYDYAVSAGWQHIEQKNSDKSWFIPTYIHGYNIFKTRQLCIGSDEVLWIDLLLFQTSGLKQWVIDRLRPHNDIIALTRLGQKNEYTFGDLKKLTNYDLLAMSNRISQSVASWDTALTAGQPAFILVNDNISNGTNLSDIGDGFTLLNIAGTTRKEVINALKSGNTYGVSIKPIPGESLEEKAARVGRLPKVESFDLSGDTLSVKVSAKVNMIRFVGQGGREVFRVLNSDSATYLIQSGDRYVRTEILSSDGTIMYLNPVFRYSNDKPLSKMRSGIDVNVTGWLRFLYFVIVALAFWYFTRKLPSKQRK